MQCTTMTPSADRISKYNSCYTGSIVLIKEGEKLKVEALAPRNITFEHEKSFFGLYKIADIPRQQ